ncbi:MAG: molybdopterin-guanine dinucleotide biosynthesis protein B [Planctomycetaceae bacterium]
MNRIHIIGGKNHGKTRLLCELVAEFRKRNLRVGTIKHTHHHHELDTPGKDSHRHCESGASVVGILTRSMNAVFWPGPDAGSADEATPSETRYSGFATAFSGCHLVLVEGDTKTTAPKLEVWRAALETCPMAGRVLNVLAIVTDDPVETCRPVLRRDNIPAIADFLWHALRIHQDGNGQMAQFSPPN